MAEKKQHITLQIDCHTIALSVRPEEEPMYRDAGKRLNALYQQYAKAYPSMPVAQLWIYVALAVAVNLQSDAREKNIAPILEKIRELNQVVEQTLNSHA